MCIKVPYFIRLKQLISHGDTGYHMSKVAVTGNARAGKLHQIGEKWHLDTCMKLIVLKSVVVPPLEYAVQVWEGNMKVIKSSRRCR